MSTARDWFELAGSNLDAAVRLRESHVASSVSRAYYAAYSAAHAIAIACGETPPSRGNWPHEGLGELVRTVLSRGQEGWRRAQLVQHKKAIGELQSLRVRADYLPGSVPGDGDWIAQARQIVALAGRLVS